MSYQNWLVRINDYTTFQRYFQVFSQFCIFGCFCILVRFIQGRSCLLHSFHHEPNSDFQTFLKSSLLPCAAHRPLPVHDLFPERNLISNIVIYKSIHSVQAAQPLFQLLFFGLCNFPGICVFLYWVILRVMFVDQIKQVLHWRVILRLCFLQILLQHFLQFFYNATILPN